MGLLSAGVPVVGDPVGLVALPAGLMDPTHTGVDLEAPEGKPQDKVHPQAAP